MVKHRKDPANRMDTDIRVPVTAGMKRVILEASAGEPLGMAEWCRKVLLEAARAAPKKRRKKS